MVLKEEMRNMGSEERRIRSVRYGEYRVIRL
jgi:hypothetical protein